MGFRVMANLKDIRGFVDFIDKHNTRNDTGVDVSNLIDAKRYSLFILRRSSGCGHF